MRKDSGAILKTGEAGLVLIKSFECCRLNAYKCVSTEQYYTIGYGHYGPDVAAKMTIAKEQADNYLKADVNKFEKYVNETGLNLNQNQFDALVSFTYNCGAGNLKKLLANRSLSQVADALLQYNKSGGVVLSGLTKRRNAERELFLSDAPNENASIISQQLDENENDEEFVAGTYQLLKTLNVRSGAGLNYKVKQKNELSDNAKKECNDNGQLLAGTKVTIKQVIKNEDGIWGIIPSGYIAMKQGGNVYVAKYQQ